MKAAEEGAVKAAADATRRPEIPRWCPRCAGPLSKDMEMRSWTISPLVRDSFSYIGSGLGGIAGSFYGFNYVMPVVRRHIRGPMWMHYFVGTPPVIVFSAACAGLLGGTIPATAQLISSSYHVVSSQYFARSSSHVATHGPPSTSHDNMHKTRSSSPLSHTRAEGARPSPPPPFPPGRPHAA